MKKKLSRLITFVVVCCIVAAFYVPASAASAGVHFNDPSTILNQQATVNISIGPDVAYYDITLNYNVSHLSFVDASGSTGNFYCDSSSNGQIRITDFASSGATTFSCSIVFYAHDVGAGKVTVGYAELIDTNGDVMETSLGSSTVTINPIPSLSEDATLSALSISPGTLSPAFSPSIKNYTATVPNNVTSIAVSATKNDSNATMVVKGNTSLSVGTNTVKVELTAEDGFNDETYTIVVTRMQGTSKPDDQNKKPDDKPADTVEQPKEIYVLTTDGQTLRVREKIEDPETIPTGFTLTTTKIENKDIDGITYGENAPVYVYLFDEKDTESADKLYTVNADGIAEPLVYLGAPEAKYTMTDISLAEAPAGYVPGKVKIGEQEYDAFVPEDKEASEHYLLPCMNEKGEISLYTYDPAEGSFQRFGLISTEAAEPQIVEVPVEVEAEPQIIEVPAEVTTKDILKNKVVSIALVGGITVIVLLIALAIVLGIMYSRKSKACQMMAEKRGMSDNDIFY